MSEETAQPTGEAPQNAEVSTEKEAEVKTESEEKDVAQEQESQSQEQETQPQEQAAEKPPAPVKPEVNDSPIPNKISGATIKSQYIRLRGLPFNATEKDIHEFFSGLTVKRVKFVCTTGRPNGEAYVEFSNKDDAGKGIENDRKEMNSRYIEIFSVSETEGEFEFRPDPDGNGEENHVVRLRGVPWACKEEDVANFFHGLEPAPAEIVIGGTGGPKSRPSGEAFARFTTQEAAEKALEFNNKHMGNRYVEVFMSSMVELNRAKGGGGSAGSYEQRTGIRPLMSLDRSDSGYHQSSRGGGGGYGYGGSYDDYSQGAYGAGGRQDYGYNNYDQGGYGDGYGNGGGYEGPMRVYMRGLPYDADHHAIEAFFSPLRVHSIKLGINDSGRSSGDAIAEFDSYQDLEAGLSRNNHRMGRRYVELFDSRSVPGPMRRLLWKETSGPNVLAAPAPDPILNGGKRSAPAAREPVYRAGPQAMPPSHREPRDPYGPRAPRSYEREPAPTRAPAPPHGRAPDPWGPYGSSYDQSSASATAAAWEAYAGYGSSATQAVGYGATAAQAGYGASATQAGYGASAAQTGYSSAGYSSTASSTYGAQPAASGYDRQRESRESQSPWAQQQQQQSSYGGWGTGASTGDRRGY